MGNNVVPVMILGRDHPYSLFNQEHFFEQIRSNCLISTQIMKTESVHKKI